MLAGALQATKSEDGYSEEHTLRRRTPSISMRDVGKRKKIQTASDTYQARYHAYVAEIQPSTESVTHHEAPGNYGADRHQAEDSAYESNYLVDICEEWHLAKE